MADRWKQNPIESEARIAAEQEAKALETIRQTFRRTTPMGKKRLTEREQVARWLVATPEQRQQAQTQWPPGAYERWNTQMFKALMGMRK